MMNRRGIILGFALLLVLFILLIAVFALIEPFKESLDSNRGSSTLNCPGTPDFNQTSYADDSTLEKLTRRPTCFVTGLSMTWFVFYCLIAGVVWVARNWSKGK